MGTMTPAEMALALFALCNSVRVFAYVLQIVVVARDRTGAGAVSCTTWGLFAVSHLSTVAYALLTLHDWRMVAVFGANSACCAAILGLTAPKRAQFRRQRPCRDTASKAPPAVLGLAR